MVTLEPITPANRAAIEALRVSPAQEQFVSGVAESLLEAAAEPAGRAIPWGVYAGATPVGFVMISDEVGAPGYIAHYLWKLLIDARHQRRGYGTAALDLIVAYFRAGPGVEVLWTSAGRATAAPSRSPSATGSSRPARSSSRARCCSGCDSTSCAGRCARAAAR